MKIAIPVFGERVSPRFDFSPEMLIITVENGKEVKREKLTLGNLDICRRLDQLISMGVDRVICGGIDGLSLNKLNGRGIEVISDVMGESSVAFDLFLRGRLISGACCEKKRKMCARIGSKVFY